MTLTKLNLRLSSDACYAEMRTLLISWSLSKDEELNALIFKFMCLAHSKQQERVTH